LHELSSKADNEVGAISNFTFLHFSGHSNHLSCRVMNFNFSDNGSGIRGDKELFEVIDNHFVHAYINTTI